MNAEAHLRAQGWQGPGNGLRAGSLQRAILTSKKTDLKGLGAKVNESDQWWDNIFSKQLSNITVTPQGIVGQINGGVSAAHPVAARHAHHRHFGDKNALHKVFIMGEVLKGNPSFIPLPPEKVESARMPEQKRKPGISALPSPPPSPIPGSAQSSTTEQQLYVLSDKALRKETRRIKRETKAINAAAKAARKERRRLKKTKKLAKAGS